MLRSVASRVLFATASRASSVAAVDNAAPNLETFEDSEVKIQPNPYLSLFPSPKVVVPTFELTRRLGTLISQTVYQLVYERAYNKEGFVRAANEGVSVLGECIANEEWNRMGLVASKDLVEEAKLARTRCTSEQLALLRFSPDDVVLSFIHSSFLSGRDFRNRKAEQGVISIYFTVASFIRRDNSVPWEATLSQLLNKYKNDAVDLARQVLFRFARNVSPLGPWKATGLNFFELDSVSKRH